MIQIFSDKSGKYNIWTLFCLFLFAGLFFPVTAISQESAWQTSQAQESAEEPQGQPAFALQNFYLSGNENMLTAKLAVSISNIQYLHDILRDGARLVIECHSGLYRKRSFWANAMIGEHNFSSSLKYNPLQRDFIIFSDSGASIANTNLPNLVQATWGNLEMPLAELNQLEKGETYLAIISLTLRHEEMPPWLGKNVFFWSDIIIPVQKYELEFDY